MALYGDGFYGLFKYGPATLVSFDASPFVATSPDYAVIQLTWKLPTGNWDLLHLVRNTLGFPVTPDDGDLLLSTTPSVSVTSYVDRRLDPLTGAVIDPKIVEGKIYYYSIFVRSVVDGSWINAGVASGTAVKNFGTADLMYAYLPLMYKSPSINGLTTNVSEVNQDLYNFLRLFAFEYDKFKTDAENVKRRYDVANLNGKLIPLMMNQFGFVYEAELGIQQGRRLLQSAVEIYRKKGSVSGLRVFASAFSGYNVDLGSAKNLLLDINDSSFEKSVGSWNGVTNVTLSRITGASESPAVVPYLEPTSPSNYPNGTSGILKAVITTAATASFSCGQVAPATKGVPVTAGDAYSFTIYSRAKTDARSVSLNIKWYDRFGVYISEGTAATSTNSTSAWSRATKVTATAPGGSAAITNVAATTSTATFTATNNFVAGQKVTITGLTSSAAPLNLIAATIATASGSSFTVSGTFTALSSTAVSGATATVVSGYAQFAVPTVSIASGGAGEIHYFDAAQFEAGSSATDYVDARRVDIYLGPNRVNELINPSFTTNTNNWTAFTGSLARVTGTGAFGVSDAWGALTASGTNPILKAAGNAAGGVIAVFPNTPYTFSTYVKSSASGDSVKARIVWLDSASSTISTYNDTYTNISTSWGRYSTTATSPANAVKAMVFIDFTSVSGRVLSVDAAMFEAAPYTQPYFDGSTGYYETDDLLWEDGDAVNGRSLYYRNRLNVTKRLSVVLPDYLPFGTQWALFVGVS